MKTHEIGKRKHTKKYEIGKRKHTKKYEIGNKHMYCIKHKGNCTKEAYILHENICMPYISAHMCILLHSCSNSGWDAGWDAVADAGCSGCRMWLMPEAVADAGCSGTVCSGTGCCG